jgi:hypothetical protein
VTRQCNCTLILDVLINKRSSHRTIVSGFSVSGHRVLKLTFHVILLYKIIKKSFPEITIATCNYSCVIDLNVNIDY